MMKWARDFRLIPFVLLATVCLFVLKVSGLVFDGGYTLADKLRERGKSQDLTLASADSIPDNPAIIVENGRARQSWAREMFNFGGDRPSKDDITGSVASKPAEAAPPKPDNKAVEPAKAPEGIQVNTEAAKLAPAGERAILERLQDRRTDLDARAREVEMRESLLKAAEKRVEARVDELKSLEAKVTTAAETRDKAEVERFKNIVTMYENMKPKEAARIFDKLDLRVLFDISTQMNPRKMSEVLAQMSPDAAQTLTVEIANRSANDKSKDGGLPKIDGRPNGM